MSWDAQQPQGEQPQQPPEPYQQTQPYQPTQPYGQPVPPEQPTTPYPYAYGPQGDPAQQTAAYGQPGSYEQPPPQWDQQGGYGGPYYPAYQPPKRGRTGFYVALGAVALVVAVGVAVGIVATSSNSANGTLAANGANSSASAATAPSTATSATPAASATTSTSTSTAPQTPRTVTVPQTAGPLTLLVNADTASRISNIKSNLAGNAAYSNPQIGFYTIGSESNYSVWMLAEDTANLPTFRSSLTLLGFTGMARSIARGANMTNVTTENAGPLGGALLCGRITVTGGTYRVCEWVDGSTFGWVYFTPSVRQSNILTYTLDLRSAAEQ
jgi:hypothetical protein